MKNSIVAGMMIITSLMVITSLVNCDVRSYDLTTLPTVDPANVDATVDDSKDYMLIKIPLKIQRQHRHKRFIGGLLAGVSAFIVKSGIWSAFKISCIEFLKYTGGAIIGEVFDKFYNDKRRKREIMDIPLEIMEEEFADGCTSEFGCYSPLINLTQDKILREVGFVPKGQCTADGLVRLQSKQQQLYLPTKFYHHEFRDRCFPKELMCLIILDIHVMAGEGAVLGCNSCGGILLNIHFAAFNTTSIEHVSYCRFIDGRLGITEPSSELRGIKMMTFSALRAQMIKDLRPTPALSEHYINRSIAIEIVDNDKFITNILN